MIISKLIRQARFSLAKVVSQIVKSDAFVILTDHNTGLRSVVRARNIVTNAGDIYYAQRGATEAPTETFNSLYLCTGGPVSVAKTDDTDDYTEAAGSEKLVSASYPRTNDPDGDNTDAGVDVVSWLFSYTTGDGPFATPITHSYISVASAGAAQAILNSYEWAASWTKDASTSAKVFMNHEMNGV